MEPAMRTHAEFDLIAKRHRQKYLRINEAMRQQNIMPPLDSFTIKRHETITDPLKIHDEMSEEENEK
jgi:hypothetical protein